MRLGYLEVPGMVVFQNVKDKLLSGIDVYLSDLSFVDFFMNKYGKGGKNPRKSIF